MSFIIIATFKSNKTSGEIEDWIKSVSPAAKKSSAEIGVAPSFPYLGLVKKSSGLELTAQDVSPFPAGSYTGAVNAVQLLDMGVRYCLVGHSERRRYFHETHAEIANKINELIAVGITPVLCLAEEDIFPAIAAIPSENQDKIVYCYEPPADIGGTVTAPVEDIDRVIGLIRNSVEGSRVMYGGSVNADNLDSLIPLGIDGVLVSSASLDPGRFTRLISVYAKSEKK